MIRPATTDDLEDILQLINECGLYKPQLDYSTFSQPTIVYEANEEIVGMVQMLMGHPYSYMSEICVHPKHRDQGIASKLVAAAEHVLSLCGVKAWGGLAIEENVNSQQRMLHLGGQEVKRGVVYIKVIG